MGANLREKSVQNTEFSQISLRRIEGLGLVEAIGYSVKRRYYEGDRVLNFRQALGEL